MTDPRDIECEDVVSHLLAYLDDEIDDETRARIDRHLERCRGCFSRAEFERALRHRLRELGREPASESLARRIKALLDSF